MTKETLKQTAVIVIPTYNEAGNIGKMIDYLNTKTFPSITNKIEGLKSDWDMRILVVDDSSPDGTSAIVEKYSKKYTNTHLLCRSQKTGLGSAYADGFKYAVEKLKADYVFEFDADFQHPPETLPSMLKAMEEGYDYVIGSRKIKGGAEPEGRDLFRTMLTEGGGLLARLILFFPFKPFFQVTDPTTGLKVTRVKGFVDRMDLSPTHFYSRKFGYKVQWLAETISMGAKFKEVPLKFENRTSGESKFENDTTTEILISCLKTRWYDKTTQKFLKFGTVGFLGFVVNSIFMELFRSMDFTQSLATSYSSLSSVPFLAVFATASGWAAALGAEVAIVSNFLLNNFWTFSKDRITNPFKFIGKFLQFNLTSIGAVIIQFVVIGLATIIFGDKALVRQLALIFAIGFLIIPYNWLMYNTFIWKNKKKSN